MNYHTQLVWAGPGKLADAPNKEKLHSRYCEENKMGSNRLEASHGVFIVFFLIYFLTLSSVTEPCFSLIVADVFFLFLFFKLFSTSMEANVSCCQGTVYCRSTLDGKAECLHFRHTHMSYWGPAAESDRPVLFIYLFI